MTQVPEGTEKIIFKDESYEIVGAAIRVWKTLGYGFLEKVYENALVIELRKRDSRVEQQKPVKVHYEGQIVGDYVADIVVNDAILLEIKSAQFIADEHVAQTLNYLKATGIRLGIILNFGPEQLEHKRLVM
jgi:GxxExxY protein